jgi:ATP synthase protein I
MSPEEPRPDDRCASRQPFREAVRRRRERLQRARQEEDSFWRYVGLLGTVGWSVVLPMVLGGLLGLWLDTLFATGSAWTLTLLLLGLALGMLNAWRLIHRGARHPPPAPEERP